MANKFLSLIVCLTVFCNFLCSQSDNHFFVRMKVDVSEYDKSFGELKIVAYKFDSHGGKGYEPLDSFKLSRKQEVINIKLTEISKGNITLYAKDSLLASSPTFIYSKDTLTVKFKKLSPSAYVYGGENEFYYSNQLLPFTLPGLIMNDKGFKPRMAHLNYAINFPTNILLQFKYKEYERNVLKLVEENPSNFHLLTKLLKEADNISFQTLDTAYNLFKEDIKKTKPGRLLQTYIANGKWLQLKPDLSTIQLKDTAGRVLSLSSCFDSTKLTYIDFWASWCLPCRDFNRNLAKHYQQIDTSALSIISISIDESVNKWNLALNADNTPWKNLIDPTLGGFNGTLAKLFNIQFIPQSFLFNREGEIIATNTELSELIKLSGAKD